MSRFYTTPRDAALAKAKWLFRCMIAAHHGHRPRDVIGRGLNGAADSL